jgi:hypothetical protein
MGVIEIKGLKGTNQASRKKVFKKCDIDFNTFVQV